MSNPALWVAIAGVITAAGGVVQAFRAKSRADDAHQLATGHALDTVSHPSLAARVRGRRPPPPPPAGPAPLS